MRFCLSRIADFLHCHLRYTADATMRGWGKRDAGAGRFDYAGAEAFQPLVSALVCGRTHIRQLMLLNSRFSSSLQKLQVSLTRRCARAGHAWNTHEDEIGDRADDAGRR